MSKHFDESGEDKTIEVEGVWTTFDGGRTLYSVGGYDATVRLPYARIARLDAIAEHVRGLMTNGAIVRDEEHGECSAWLTTFDRLSVW